MTDTPTACYKLTDQQLQTHNGYQWVVGKERATSGKGALCGPGWLHCYDDPHVALFLNPIHAAIWSPRVWLAEGRGQTLDDRGRKRGYTQMRLVREITDEVPVPTRTQRVAFGVLCALSLCNDAGWREWAERWLSGEDRSAAAANAAANAANAAYAAANAYAATYATYATYAAAYATDAAAVGQIDLPWLAAWALTFGEDT